jgi:hypothetical protein
MGDFVYRNKNVGTNDEHLYDLITDKTAYYDNDPNSHLEIKLDNESKILNFHNGNETEMQLRQLRQLKQNKGIFSTENMSTTKKIMYTVLLLICAAILLWLTVLRLGLAGKSLYNGNTLSGLAMLSPEISSITGMLLI